jgi:hypothetical protein
MKDATPKLTNVLLNELVINEATKLKKKAKKAELKQLDFEKLSTQNVTKCIYGQMTGHCFNKRAVELIEASCKRVLKCSITSPYIDGTLNGSPKDSRRDYYWSPIEVFIDRPRNKTNGNNKRLVAFLRDETKELKLR